MYQSSKTNRNAADYISAMEAEPTFKKPCQFPKNDRSRGKLFQKGGISMSAPMIPGFCPFAYLSSNSLLSDFSIQ